MSHKMVPLPWIAIGAHLRQMRCCGPLPRTGHREAPSHRKGGSPRCDSVPPGHLPLWKPPGFRGLGRRRTAGVTAGGPEELCRWVRADS
jgi:hypothetical protein